jgi:hypothetical protein
MVMGPVGLGTKNASAGEVQQKIRQSVSHSAVKWRSCRTTRAVTE